MILSVMSNTLDVIVVLCYMVVTIAIGIYFSRKTTTTEEYFVGNRSYSGWVIGLSMVGTSISSVTFLAFPAAAYSSDWSLMVPNLLMPLGVLMAVYVFIPFFRRNQITSAFEYLEDRYGSLARLYGTLNYMLGQVLRLGIVLYLASITIGQLLGVSVLAIIIVGGVFVTIYTVIGGIEAVIWTDVIQTIVLLCGGVICFAFIVWNLPHGLPQLIEIADEHSKFSLGSIDPGLSQQTIYTMIVLGAMVWIQAHVCDQNVVQRYLAASSLKEARKATYIACAISLPTWSFFFLIGTGLFVFFQVSPDPQVTGMNADHVFPFFILNHLPAGLAGLIIAAAIAAAMSSLDSSINAVSLLTVVDLFKRHLIRGQSDRYYLRLAHIFAIVTGLVMIGSAIMFYNLEGESALNTLMTIGAMVMGPLMGMYILGFFTTRVKYNSLLLSLCLTTIIHLWLILNEFTVLPERWQFGLHIFWVTGLVNVSFIVLAYALSWFLPSGPDHSLEGLTVWTNRSSLDLRK